MRVKKKKKTHLTSCPQHIHHLLMHLAQDILRPLRNRRVALRKSLPAQLAQRVVQALGVELLETQCVRSRRRGRCRRCLRL